MKLTLTLLLASYAIFGYSQVTNKGVPQSWRAKNLSEVQKIILPTVNEASLLAEDALTATQKQVPYRFAYEFTTSYTLQNSGSWSALPNGDRIWRFHITSPGAKGMHFWFRDFYIPPGATLYVYNNAHTDLLGAYDARQNNNGSYFGTWPVAGDDVWLEYFEPKAQAGNGKFTICKTGHVYRTVNGLIKTSREVFSGDCNYDVECFMPGVENRKDITKHSVTRIIGSTATGAFLASGAAINNTANDGRPYILSANHAWVEDCMYTFRFNWINPNPVCPNAQDGDSSINEVQTISGATLRARREESDFMLLEINSPIPQEWGVVYSGWDHSDDIPSLTYGVHHPAGDIMKVCVAYDTPGLNNDNWVWDVQAWDIGVTEGGSSGSPLLTPEGRIIGQLWYGASGCNGSESNHAGDSYGRFGVSWETGETPETRLREWLDPLNTGTLTLDPYPAQTIYTHDAKMVVTELGQENCSEIITPQVRLVNYGSASLTSAVITYTLNSGEEQSINWQGELPENQATVLSLPTLTGVPGENTLNAWVSSINGTDDDNTANSTSAVTFEAYPTLTANSLVFSLTTDGYASETSWELLDQYGSELYSMPVESYENFGTYTQTLTLPNDGCYTFIIHDSYGDGICCAYGNGSYSLVSDTGITIAQGGSYTSAETTAFKIQRSLGTDSAYKTVFAAYPNPSTGTYLFKGINNGDSYNVYNTLGQCIQRGTFSSETAQINLSTSAAGVYIVSVSGREGKSSCKLIKE